MGLDVGLYYSDDWDFSIECEKAQESFDHEYYILEKEAENLGRTMIPVNEYLLRPDVFQTYKKYLSQEKRGVFEFDKGIHRIEEDSPRHPEVYFKIGYFRSSYNSSGINHVLRDLDLPDLYDIFSVTDSDGYYVFVDWMSAKRKIVDVLEKFRPMATEYYVCNLNRYNMSGKSSLELLKFVIEKKSEKHDVPAFISDAGYICSGVEFYPVGTEIIAATDKYIVCKTKGVEGFAGYLPLLEVVEDTIDYVLKQEHPENYRLGWSA